MRRMIVHRLAMAVLVLACVTTATFLMSRVVPGDAAQVIAGPRATPATIASIRAQLGTDRPLIVQYGTYMSGLLHGDLGRSVTTQHPVSEDLAAYFPATLELIVYALLLALAVGIPLGVLAAVRKDSGWDGLARVVALGGLSMPIFWSALVLIVLFYGVLGWLPSSGRLASNLPPPPRITTFYTVDAALTGYWATFVDSVKHLLLPVVSLAYVQLGIIVRQVRSSMVDVLALDYVRTARAAGLSSRTVIFRYALRNSLVPMLTVIGVILGALLGGAVVTETIFDWPGMGNYVVKSIATRDFPAIMGFTIIVAIGYVLINLAVDLINFALNPQLRRTGGRS